MAAQTFVVIATDRASDIKRELENLQGAKIFELKDDTWFVTFEGTTRELVEKTGIRGGRSGAAVAVLVGGTAGYTRGDLWEWLRVNRGSDG